MQRQLMISFVFTALMLAGCGTTRPNVSLGLGQITCPASALTEVERPETIDPRVLSQMPAPISEYVILRESAWETALANASQVQVDTLTLCADINRRVADAEAR